MLFNYEFPIAYREQKTLKSNYQERFMHTDAQAPN